MDSYQPWLGVSFCWHTGQVSRHAADAQGERTRRSSIAVKTCFMGSPRPSASTCNFSLHTEIIRIKDHTHQLTFKQWCIKQKNQLEALTERNNEADKYPGISVLVIAAEMTPFWARSFPLCHFLSHLNHVVICRNHLDAAFEPTFPAQEFHKPAPNSVAFSPAARHFVASCIWSAFRSCIWSAVSSTCIFNCKLHLFSKASCIWSAFICIPHSFLFWIKSPKALNQRSGVALHCIAHHFLQRHQEKFVDHTAAETDCVSIYLLWPHKWMMLSSSQLQLPSHERNYNTPPQNSNNSC